MTHISNNTQLISRQFRRKNPDGSLTRGYGFWEDMEESHTWDFVCQFLPNYETRDEVAVSDDLACVLNGHEYKDLYWLYRKYEQWDGYFYDELIKIQADWDNKLIQEAKEYLEEAIKSGEIEVREFPVSIVSARIQGDKNNDRVWLQCADQTTLSCGVELHILSSELQNVKSRWINEGTDEEKFQIFLERENSGAPYWCNAQSIDFE